MLSDILLILLVFSPLSIAFIAPSIYTDHIAQNDAIGRFVQIERGETLSLRCEHPQNEEVVFAVPDLQDFQNYDSREYNGRLSIKDSTEGLRLTIVQSKESDSGTYKCHMKDDETLIDEIHVFVKGASVFIPSTIHGFAVSMNDFVVPCKTSRHLIGEQIQLIVNGKNWKNAWKHFDPRKGFSMNSKTIEEKISGASTFKCIFKGPPEDLAEFLISEKVQTDNTELELVWVESNAWPYVGGEYELSCDLVMREGRMTNQYQYHLNVTCPRCHDTEAVVQSNRKSSANRMSHRLNIATLTEEDSGNYICNWYFEKDLMKTISHPVKVSLKKGQLKIISTTKQEVTVHEGSPFSFAAELAGFPEDLTGFTANWIRKFVRPPRTAYETEAVLTDASWQLESDLPGGGRVLESLNVKQAHTNMSGVYVLSLQLLDTVKTIEYMLNVMSRGITSRIDILSPDSFVEFDQKYYKYGTQLRVLCVVTSLPHAEVALYRRRIFGSSVWIDVEESDMTKVNGTYESGWQWDTTLEDDMELKCTGRRGDMTSEDRKRVRGGEREPSVSTTWQAPPTAPSQEDNSHIYEGDLVIINCSFPKDDDWTAKWMFRDKELTDVTDDVRGISHNRNLVANIRNIASSDAGEYACVLSNKGMYKTLKQTIQVVKTRKPYQSSSDDEAPRMLTYGKDVTFDCNMDGTPIPRYLWLKDGRIYTGGQLSDDNRTLTITRVAAEDKGEFECQAVNRAGAAIYTFTAKVEGAPKRVSGIFVTLLSIMVLLLLISLAAVLILYLRQKKKASKHRRELDDLYREFMASHDIVQDPKIPIEERPLTYSREFELSRENLEIGNKLGDGAFGVVYMGWLKKPRRVSDDAVERQRLPVAVKAPRDGKKAEQQKMLASELKVMCAMGRHPNVLSVIGGITKNMKEGELFVVVEMCDNGNLKDYLLKNKLKFVNELKEFKAPDDGYLMPNSALRTAYASEQNEEWADEVETDRLLGDSAMLATSDLISFAMQVANGMEYLASLPCIHRDLAARNILVTSNRICRIADFGLARNDGRDYYKLRASKEQALPIRWMAIEAIVDRTYTQGSDVWSFGILLFEIFTLGGLPYPTISNEDILDRLQAGHRNNRPPYCHEDIYALMQRCWDVDTLERPTFSECLRVLKDQLVIASPVLLNRLETEIVKEGEKQNALVKWLEEEDYGPTNGLTQQQEVSSPAGERIYIKDFPSTSRNHQ